ncbi:hypothetical protein [Nonomuraea sp. LPB2021202275-12-8]|uniref:hypothetical protein n=1 Tax=Nonomuraea sp. LPB2021202275-12-8 TaxID=3120159 RepID=UPI00300D62E9
MKLVTRVAMLGAASAILIATLPAASASADGSPRITADGRPLPLPAGVYDSNIWG